MDGGWIVIPSWDRFQHYTDRDPVWIKVYTSLVHNPDFLELRLADRGLLLTLWVLYARTLGQLRGSRVFDFMPARYPRRHVLDSLQALNDAGFIQIVASKPLALARSREKRREEKKEPATTSKKKPGPKTDSGPINMPPRDEAAYVRKLIANHIITEPFELDAYNLDDALRRELRQLL